MTLKTKFGVLLFSLTLIPINSFGQSLDDLKEELDALEKLETPTDLGGEVNQEPEPFEVQKKPKPKPVAPVQKSKTKRPFKRQTIKSGYKPQPAKTTKELEEAIEATENPIKFNLMLGKIDITVGSISRDKNGPSDGASGFMMEPRFKTPITLFDDWIQLWAGLGVFSLRKDNTDGIGLKAYLQPKITIIPETLRLTGRLGYMKHNKFDFNGALVGAALELELHKYLWLEFGADNRTFQYGLVIAFPSDLERYSRLRMRKKGYKNIY